jgi:hypothetical protein
MADATIYIDATYIVPRLWREDADTALGKIYEVHAGIAGEPVGQDILIKAWCPEWEGCDTPTFPDKVP